MVTDRKIKHIFSSDGSGGIEVDEMIKMLLMIYENTDSETGLSRVECVEKARDLFNYLDSDGNNELTEDEFVDGCLADETILERLLRGSKTSEDDDDDDDDNENEN
ncbi:neuronal calcium sensor 2-like [Eurytemora carolleeae]|uniref:neuronal calcium sensor 2-like n=1 Tax=Eurytemora carolleeae TaxID=1294199 RepID=UPI000C7846FB|nr:neuronal calcium sensor 2-like [Eurytemora carolleeae]|eukprot:XP_023344488.1 neuronal calcium sensor 2-like [Eurytemora affinis]